MHVCIVLVSVSVYNSVPESVFVCMTLHFCSLCVVLLLPALVPLYLVAPILRACPSVCQRLPGFPAAWLCAICASSWRLAGITLLPVLKHVACVCSLHPAAVCIVLSSLLLLIAR